jgi:hypothetical protein
MSWQEKIKQNIIITTGDGKVWGGNQKQEVFMYKDGTTEIDYNTVAFEYIGIEGAEVVRSEASKLITTITIVFQGEKYLEECDEFLISAKDINLWEIEHPKLGLIKGMPVSSSRDDSSENTCIVSITFWESKIDSNTKRVDVKNEILDGINISHETLIANAKAITPDLIVSDVNKFKANLNSGAKTEFDRNNLSDKIGKITGALNKRGIGGIELMTRVSSLLRTPGNFFDTIMERNRVLRESQRDLFNAARGIILFPKKVWLELAGGTILLSMCESSLRSLTEIGKDQGIEVESDTLTRLDILNIVNSLSQSYNEYISILNEKQSTEDIKEESYYPNAENIRNIKNAIARTQGNLFEISQNAKQVFEYTLTENMSLVRLIYKLNGNTDHRTVIEFMKLNSMTIEDILLIEKGKTIKYMI